MNALEGRCTVRTDSRLNARARTELRRLLHPNSMWQFEAPRSLDLHWMLFVGERARIASRCGTRNVARSKSRLCTFLVPSAITKCISLMPSEPNTVQSHGTK